MDMVNTGESSLAAGFSGRGNVYFGGGCGSVYIYSGLYLYIVSLAYGNVIYWYMP